MFWSAQDTQVSYSDHDEEQKLNPEQGVCMHGRKIKPWFVLLKA